MVVKKLSRNQLIELKQAYLINLDNNGTLNAVLYNDNDCDDSLSYNELANADKLVSDDVILREYDGVQFTNEDFSLNNNN